MSLGTRHRKRTLENGFPKSFIKRLLFYHLVIHPKNVQHISTCQDLGPLKMKKMTIPQDCFSKARWKTRRTSFSTKKKTSTTAHMAGEISPQSCEVPNNFFPPDVDGACGAGSLKRPWGFSDGWGTCDELKKIAAPEKRAIFR